MTLGLAVVPAQDDLDPAARRWVEETLGRLTVDEKVGPARHPPTFRSLYTSSDSAIHDDLMALVREHHVGGMHVFGARRGRPDVLLNPTYSRTVLGQPLAAASLLNRLQAAAEDPPAGHPPISRPGVGFRMAGAHELPARHGVRGRRGDPRLAFEAGRITAVEARGESAST